MPELTESAAYTVGSMCQAVSRDKKPEWRCLGRLRSQVNYLSGGLRSDSDGLVVDTGKDTLTHTKHVLTQAHTHTHIHTRMCRIFHVDLLETFHAPVPFYTHKNTSTRPHARACTHAHREALKHTQTHTLTRHTHKHTHTHTHTNPNTDTHIN